MKEFPEFEKPVSNWAVAGGMVVFAGLFLLWAVGFDLLAGWIQGGAIEAVLNWVSGAWYWVALVAVVVAVILKSLSKPQDL
jgi:hypothetical protein